MASIPKPVNGNTTSNGIPRKRKKSREGKGQGSYLSKWLDKTMHHIQESTPSMDTYESYINSNLNWRLKNMPGPPNFDPSRCGLYGCAPEPMSLPTIPTFYNPPMLGTCYPDFRYVENANKSIPVQNPRQHRKCNRAEDVTNGVNGSFNSSYLQSKHFGETQDFASLPPIVTSAGDTTSNSDLNTTEKDDGNARRFSDPCVRGLPEVQERAEDGSESSSGSSGSHVGSKLLTCLLDQITALKMANDRLNKDLQETRAELQTLRQQNALWQRGSSANLGAATVHSPLSNNGIVGPTYSPGMVTDVVREIREAARVREDALYARVRTMLLDRNDSNSLRPSDTDNRRMLDRITKLEDELRVLRLGNGVESAEIIVPETAEAERVRLRKELADMRKAKQHSDEQAHKLERLVTQLRFKLNGLQIPAANGPESLPSSEPDHEANSRARRTSVNSTNNSTVVFGPVTDL